MLRTTSSRPRRAASVAVALGSLSVLGACGLPGGGTPPPPPPPSPVLTATPAQVQLISPAGGPMVSDDIVITNVGTAATGPLTVIGGGSLLTGNTCSGAVLAPNGTCTLTFSFTPPAAGTVHADANGSVFSFGTGAATAFSAVAGTAP